MLAGSTLGQKKSILANSEAYFSTPQSTEESIQKKSSLRKANEAAASETTSEFQSDDQRTPPVINSSMDDFFGSDYEAGACGREQSFTEISK